jgi:hypothetical protein
MKLFDQPHPVGAIILGVIFITLGLLLGPLIHPPGERTGFDPILQHAPTWGVIAIMVFCGSVLVVAGIGSLIKKRGQ